MNKKVKPKVDLPNKQVNSEFEIVRTPMNRAQTREAAIEMARRAAGRQLREAAAEKHDLLLMAVVSSKVMFRLAFTVGSIALSFKKIDKANPLQAAANFVDLIPSPGMRKVMRKLLGDQAAHIQELLDRNRFGAARWIRFSTWFLLGYTALAYPVSKLLSVARRFGA